MNVPGIPRPALVAMIAVAAVLLAFGATKAIALFTEHTDTHTRIVAAAPSIAVGVQTGDVRIVGSDRTDVRLTTKEKRSAWGGGRVEVSGDGARLHLGDRCDKVPVVDAPCSVSYVLEVPRDTAVHRPNAGFTVSFAALLVADKARELASQIRVGSENARVVTAVRDGSTIYRVVLGPYTTREEAERVGRESKQSYWIYEGGP